MKTFFALTTFIFTLQASAASIQGIWTGWGEWNYDGSGTGCPTMQLQFKESKSVLERTRGYFDCQVVGLESYPAQWIKRGPLLASEQKVLGSYDGNNLKIKEFYGDEGIYIITSIRAEGLHMDYEEIWYQADGVVLYEILGRLFKKEK